VAWLDQALDSSPLPHAFVFMHEPMFPVNCYRGRALDRNLAERDRLHDLLVASGKVRGVFNGHEHLWNRQEIDGIGYYHTGGAGAKLYADPDQGGFYHFALVSVSPDKVSCEPVRVEG
jgi:hypothetical protein